METRQEPVRVFCSPMLNGLIAPTYDFDTNIRLIHILECVRQMLLRGFNIAPGSLVVKCIVRKPSAAEHIKIYIAWICTSKTR